MSSTPIATSSSSSAAPAPTKKSRNGKACSRCRRYRMKCVHALQEGTKVPIAPCECCAKLGEDCVFVPRGQSAGDRQFRRKRPRSEEQWYAPLPHPPAALAAAVASAAVKPSPSVASPNGSLNAQLLPPHDELVEGVKAFLSSYFQLGFIHETRFLEQLEQGSVPTFLLLAILATSARFSPSLIKRFGGRRAAAEVFKSRALSLVPDEMLLPSLPRLQAFFLLGVSEWAEGSGQRAWMLSGIAVRMAGLLRLHREASYALPPDADTEAVLDSELARRTFWIIVCHDVLTGSSSRPASFPPSDISTLLPCDEDDLAFGLSPERRAALAGTEAAVLDPDAVLLPTRSLFATMCGAHVLFSKVAALACNSERAPSSRPWEPTSEFSLLSMELKVWEDSLPPRHVWTLQNLKAWRAKSCDLALLSIHLMLRLARIVLARIYLPAIASATAGGVPDPAPAGYWSQLVTNMSNDARELLQQADTLFAYRNPTDGFPPILVFALYCAGDMASYSLRWPQLCPDLAPFASSMVVRSLELLEGLCDAWPIAQNWYTTLAESTKNFADMHVATAQNRNRDLSAGGIFLHKQEDEVPSLTSPSGTSVHLPHLSPSAELGVSALLGLPFPPPLPPANIAPSFAHALPTPPPSYPPLPSIPAPPSATFESLLNGTAMQNYQAAAMQNLPSTAPPPSSTAPYAGEATPWEIGGADTELASFLAGDAFECSNFSWAY